MVQGQIRLKYAAANWHLGYLRPPYTSSFNAAEFVFTRTIIVWWSFSPRHTRLSLPSSLLPKTSQSRPSTVAWSNLSYAGFIVHGPQRSPIIHKSSVIYKFSNVLYWVSFFILHGVFCILDINDDDAYAGGRDVKARVEPEGASGLVCQAIQLSESRRCRAVIKKECDSDNLLIFIV